MGWWVRAQKKKNAVMVQQYHVGNLNLESETVRKISQNADKKVLFWKDTFSGQYGFWFASDGCMVVCSFLCATLRFFIKKNGHGTRVSLTTMKHTRVCHLYPSPPTPPPPHPLGWHTPSGGGSPPPSPQWPPPSTARRTRRAIHR